MPREIIRSSPNLLKWVGAFLWEGIIKILVGVRDIRKSCDRLLMVLFVCRMLDVRRSRPKLLQERLLQSLFFLVMQILWIIVTANINLPSTKLHMHIFFHSTWTPIFYTLKITCITRFLTFCCLPRIHDVVVGYHNYGCCLPLFLNHTLNYLKLKLQARRSHRNWMMVILGFHLVMMVMAAAVEGVATGLVDSSSLASLLS